MEKRSKCIMAKKSARKPEKDDEKARELGFFSTLAAEKAAESEKQQEEESVERELDESADQEAPEPSGQEADVSVKGQDSDAPVEESVEQETEVTADKETESSEDIEDEADTEEEKESEASEENNAADSAEDEDKKVEASEEASDEASDDASDGAEADVSADKESEESAGEVESVIEEEKEDEASAGQEVEASSEGQDDVESPVGEAGEEEAEASTDKDSESSDDGEVGASAEQEAESSAGEEAGGNEEAEAPVASATELPDESGDDVVDDKQTAEAVSEDGGKESPNPLADIIAAQKAQLREKTESAETSDSSEPVEPVESDEAGEAVEPDAETESAESVAVAGSSAEGESFDVDESGAVAESVGAGVADRSAGFGVTQDSGSGPRSSDIRGLLRSVSATHWFLVANTLAVVALAAAVFWLPGRGVQASLGREAALTGKTPELHPSPADLDAAKDSRSVSWRNARSAFAAKQYASALQQYSLLSEMVRRDPDSKLMMDFLRLRKGQCLTYLGKITSAHELLSVAAASDSPAVCAAANYQLAIYHERNGQFLQARMRAYRAASAFAALSDYTPAERNCDFLIARSLTKKALLLHGADGRITWRTLKVADLFAGLDESALRRLLDKGRKAFDRAVLGPKVRQVQVQGPMTRWSATCLQASVSELLTHFAAKAGIDLRWVSVSKAASNRAVSLYLPNVSAQRMCELSAGSAGLLARFTGEVIIVHNPSDCPSLNQQRNLLSDEAVSAWRRLFLRAMPGDKRIAWGHFAVALLHEHTGNAIEAINEYRLTVRRFSKARIAPKALLRSAKLRIGLRDYTGARTDLTELLDGYPGCHESGEAYIALGEAALKTGLADEAYHIFRKLYFLDLSVQSRNYACFGAGKCLYLKGKYDQSVEWLKRYAKLAGRTDADNLSEAYLLLGRSLVKTGNDAQSVTAFRLALSCRSDIDQKAEASIELAEAYRKTGNLARAMSTLHKVIGEIQSPRHKYQFYSTTARIYRSMSLPERGASFLRGKMPSVSDPQMHAKLNVELALCYRDAGALSYAYVALTKALEVLDPGDSSNESACELAGICLEINRPGQAVTLAGGVMKSSTADRKHRRRARSLLAEAYLAKKEYEKAALTLSGEPKRKSGAKRQ